MKKLVALEKIFGMFSKITYAEKHDELDFLKDHDHEIGLYRNKRTNEPFHARKEKVAEIDQSDIFFFVEETKKKQVNHKSKSKQKEADTNQQELFI